MRRIVTLVLAPAVMAGLAAPPPRRGPRRFSRDERTRMAAR
ncbi:MAG TPA: hypothetical protein VIZ69_11230 [Thermoanaerobaculia bacterium]